MEKIKCLLLVFLYLTGVNCFAQKFDLKTSIANGKQLYDAKCITCHQENGEGISGAFPPLAKNLTLKSKDKLVQIVLKGQRGIRKINGVEYNGEMLPVELSDSEVADVLNYIRNSWGGKETAIVPREIQPALKTKLNGYQAY